MQYLISFCVPTYNRSDFLAETLDSIIRQSDASIQIVVSDNASTDNTFEIVEAARTKFENIVYYRWDQNMGADLNYLKTVELANGEYCWFLGSDDIIRDDAVARMKKEVQESYDIYMCSEYLCDLKLKPYSVHYLLAQHIPDSVYNLSLREERLQYFSLAQSQSALFGYLSCIIFRREKWQAVVYDDTYTGTLYSHMFMLYSFMEKGCLLKYIKEPLVYWRSGNDSFGGPGKIQSRYLVDIDGFKKIMDDFFSDDEEVIKAFREVFRRHHPIKNIAYLRLNVKKKRDWADIRRKLIRDYEYNPFLLAFLWFDMTKIVLYTLFLLNRIVMKIRRNLVNIA